VRREVLACAAEGDAMAQYVVSGLEVEGLFDLGVGREREVEQD
jgi:hypothetical protein